MITHLKFYPRGIATKLFAIFLIMAFVLGSLPQASLAATEASCQATYTVKSGDYLTKIADAYDVTWSALAEANDLKSPYVIYVGQKLCIPGKSTSGSTGSTTGSSGKASFTAVKSGSSLVITTTNFPTKASYYVKVDDPRDRKIEWHKIGTLNTGKDTSVKESFKLPDDIKNASSFLVCLKNLHNDAQICNNPNYNHDADKDDSGSGSSSSATFKGTFTLKIVSKDLQITTSKFPANSFFNVKVDDATGKALEWIKVGVLRVDKDGAVTQSFSLPEKLEKASKLNVCLKNLVNDTVACHVVSR